MSEELRELVATGCRILEREGHGDLIWGHVSARDPAGRGIWMKAAGFGLQEVRAAHVILVSWDGETLEGRHRRHVEYPIHTELMRARSDVNCVVHTHAPGPVAFASLDVPLRPIAHEPTLFVPPDVVRFTLTADLIETPQLGASLAAVIGERDAVLIPAHGVVTCGATVQDAVMAAVFLERACAVNLAALAAGGPATWSSDAEALAKRGRHFNSTNVRAAWDHLARLLEG